MAGDLCLIAFCLECLLICVSAYCRSSDPSQKCVSPKEFICVPDECGNPMFVCEDQFAVEPGKCPYYNKQLQRMDVTECTAKQVCSSVPYLASALAQKSKDCLANPKRTNRCLDQNSQSTTEMNTWLQFTKQHQTSSFKNLPQDSSGAGAAVGVLVAILILLAVVVVLLVVFYRRKMFGVRKTMEPWVDSIRNHLPRNRESETRPSGRTDEETGVADETVEPLLPGNEATAKGSEKQKQGYKQLYATIKKDKIKKKEEENGVADETAKSLLPEEIKLNILQKYLVYILRREIDAKYLKEKSIIHSKSLGEHFTEPVLRDLYGVEKSDDYSNLDMSLVFALLRNFCVNIKPPTRGWDYEPPEDEETIGADIERIRYMWNRYCDHNYDFKDLDGVFDRIKNRYGTISVQNDPELQNRAQDEMEGFSEMKDKIQSIKLNPDCFVEKGIVMTGGIMSARHLLETGNVLICKGALGCGKTHTLKAIHNTYTEKEWKVRWMEENLLPLEENMEDKTILICDNLFGSFGCNIFLSSRILSFENLLESMLEKSRNTKVAVGIHQHVFDEVKRIHNLKLLQNKNITVDLDKLTKSELLLILKEQQKEGHCKTDPNCWFKTVDITNVLDKLKENQGYIGSPFLSLMYCHHHDLFSDVAFTKAPLQTLTQRFQKMKSDSVVNYSSLVYLMCVRKHEYGHELAEWAGSITAYLTKESLQKIAKHLPGFIRVENGSETLRHEVLNIALFKATADVDAIFLPVVQKCDLEILLQLMRPDGSGSTEFRCCFAYPEKENTKYRNIGKFLVKRFADAFKTNWENMEHPLKKHDFFVEKYTHYLSKNFKEK